MKTVFGSFPLLLFWLFFCGGSIPAQVVISEFMADNKHTLVDEDGQFPDWIELYNNSTTNVDLQGWSLTDKTNASSRWFFPATNLTAKGFMVVFASGKNRAVTGAPLHTDFNLKASGEYLALLKPDGSIATEFSPQFPTQYPDVSYGLSQSVITNFLVAAGDITRILIPTDGTLGSTWTQPGFNDTAWLSGSTGVGYETTVDGFAVHNYVASISTCSLPTAQGVITNPAQQLAVYAENAPVINYLNTGASSHYDQDRTFPGFTIGEDRDNFVIEATAVLTIPAPGNWTFGVSSDDGFLLTIGNFSMSYPDPRAPDDTLQTFNFPDAGDYALDLVFYECGGGSEVELYAAEGSYGSWDPTNFRLVGDSANGGLTVKAPAVSGGSGSASYRSYIKTDVQAQMLGVNASAYVRSTFAVADPAVIKSLTLRMMYDDGFVAYLNGQEIARRNAPPNVDWNSSATAAHPKGAALQFEEINISDHLEALQTGNNVLAIQALNLTAADTDLLLVPELVEYSATNTAWAYFATPTPGALNAQGFIAFVADPKFSVDRGFHDVPFSLSITCATAQADIIYTTDGSTPTPTHGTTYSQPLTVNRTTVVRATAIKTGFQPSHTDTHSYIFVNDVIRQSANGAAPAGWPSSWGGNTVDYGMDPNVVNNGLYSGEIVTDLKAIPSYSLVTDLPNLFDPATGIYANAYNDGRAWERPASIELIYPNGTKGFQINAGIRVRGGYSRSPGNPKHAFRFFFRQEYGDGKLKYPAFDRQGGVDSFDGFDLRTFENYSWSFEGDYRFIALRDQFSRDTQLAQGQPTERGDFYHLYINGQYWGLYNTDERAEASYGESYFGGNKEDYDVIKVGAGYTIFATDGDMQAWTRLWRAATNGFTTDQAYYKVQGLNVDGTLNPALENLLDVDNLIDYMLVIFFTGNVDAPISEFIGNTNPNNMYAVRNRTGRYGGFRFLAHDSEHTLLHESSLGNTDEIHRNRIGPFPAGDPLRQGPDTALACSNPQYVFSRLSANAEFRLRVADHVQRQFFNGGVLTTEACRARFSTRSNEIYQAVVGESARWGDAKVEPPRTRNAQWVTEMKRVYGDYFGRRPGIVLGQLTAKNLYPGVAAPTFTQFGGNVTNRFPLEITAPAGTIYYTLDGSDPRLRGGAVSPGALTYTSPLPLTQSVRLKARVLSGTAWSALTDATFYVIRDFTDFLITEIMYHPPASANSPGNEFEFLELKNGAQTNLDLSGVHFTGGVNFTFPLGTIVAPGQFIVLVSDPVAFTNKYPGAHVDGVYQGNLSNSGETVSLVHVTGAPIFSVTYGTRPRWPSSPDGLGFSLVPVNADFNPEPNDPVNWRASSVIGGSPGTDDTPLGIPPVLVNEALTHTDLPQLDSVELYNPAATNADISNWYLTDKRTVPKKFRIPSGATIPAHGYRVFTEKDWNADPTSTNSFRLDSHGEEIYLYSGDTQGNLTGYSDGFSFGAAQNGVSFGRYVNSVGEVLYPAQTRTTLGATNYGPRVGPVVINEIQHHAAPGGDEFVELKSITNQTVKLYDPVFPTNTWRLNGIGFNFPTGTELAPNGLLLLVPIDPAAFRTKYGVPANVPILGPYPGVLQDSGETLTLQYPDHPDLDPKTGAIFVPYIDMDVVRYNDKAPWPTNADGSGPSLERINPAAYGNDPVNWHPSSGPGSPGFDNPDNQPPVVDAGADQNVVLPDTAKLSAKANDDGLPLPPGRLTFAWSKVSGPGEVSFANMGALSTAAAFSVPGTYVLQLTANDSLLSSSASLTVTATGQPQPLRAEAVLHAGGSVSIRFIAFSGFAFTVQSCDSLTEGTWRTVADVPAPVATRSVEVIDSSTTNAPIRYYRIVSP